MTTHEPQPPALADLARADSRVYLLIRADEMSSLFAKAKDDDVAAEFIYLDEANRRLKHLGVIVLEVEMPGVRAGGYI